MDLFASQAHEELHGRFRGCLAGVAVGDALGAPFEGSAAVTEEEWTRVAGATDRMRFTDDTHMTFGVIEALLATDDFDGDNMARIFIRDYDAEPWRGYGPGPPQVFDRIKGGVRWNIAARESHAGRGSHGNGAAMRVAPVGLRYFYDLERVADIARKSASITHTHPRGRDGAVAQAVAVAWLVSVTGGIDVSLLIKETVGRIETSEMKTALETVESLIGHPPEEVAGSTGNGVAAVEAVPAALTAFLSNPESFADAIRFAVGLGGDTDTIASMTGALAGAYLGESAIPKAWRQRCEGAPSMGRLGGILMNHVLNEIGDADRDPFR